MDTRSSFLGLLVAASALLVLAAGEVRAQPGLDLQKDTLSQSIHIHPPIETGGDKFFLSTREHTYRTQLRLGDQLARDFTVKKVGTDGVPRAYEPGTQGTQNADWYGWRRAVLAPFAGTVVRVAAPDTVNAPGTMNREAQPGIVIFRDRSADISVVYAHVREIRVDEGEAVRPGEVVAKVGNNGTSRAPHVHVGAWKGGADQAGAKTGTPLQIQVDLYAEHRAYARSSASSTDR
jgi:biotin carboxyl carrier protein